MASPGDWASNRNRPRACEVTGFNTWYFSSTELHFLPVLGRRQEPQVGGAPLPITGERGSARHSPESQDYWRERLLSPTLPARHHPKVWERLRPRKWLQRRKWPGVREACGCRLRVSPKERGTRVPALSRRSRVGGGDMPSRPAPPDPSA